MSPGAETGIPTYEQLPASELEIRRRLDRQPGHPYPGRRAVQSQGAAGRQDGPLAEEEPGEQDPGDGDPARIHGSRGTLADARAAVRRLRDQEQRGGEGGDRKSVV